MSQPEEQHLPSPDMAAEVQNFYERYPYPRPIDSLEKYRRIWQDLERRRADYHLFWPSRSYREDHSILIAGCGTSQAAKHAMRWPAAQVTYTDIYLPIDAQQKKMFDAIDGTRTLGKLVGEHGQRDAAREFFERLWWYDQVVFDASPQTGG